MDTQDPRVFIAKYRGCQLHGVTKAAAVSFFAKTPGDIARHCNGYSLSLSLLQHLVEDGYARSKGVHSQKDHGRIRRKNNRSSLAPLIHHLYQKPERKEKIPVVRVEREDTAFYSIIIRSIREHYTESYTK